MTPVRDRGRELDVAHLLDRLLDLGPPSEVIARAPGEAGTALRLDRVLLSELHRGQLTAEALFVADGRRDGDELLAAARRQPVFVEYPLVEAEILRRREARRVVRLPHMPSHSAAFAGVMGWTVYVAAPVVSEGRVVGILQADRITGEKDAVDAVDDHDADHLGLFASCLSLVFERAVLRQRLRAQDQKLRDMSVWLEASTSYSSDRPIALSEQRTDRSAPRRTGRSNLDGLLTPRELEVLRLMADGASNEAIAQELVVSRGTVKFHVKNVLRKLRVANRAEATAKYLRLELSDARV